MADIHVCPWGIFLSQLQSLFPESSFSSWRYRSTLTAFFLPPVQAPHLPLLQPHCFQWQHSDRKEPARELFLLLYLPLHLLGEPSCLWPEVSFLESGGLAALHVLCSPCQSGMFQSLCKILSPFQSGHCSREEWEHGHIWKPIVSQLLHCKWSPGSHDCPVASRGDDGVLPWDSIFPKLYAELHS